MEALTIAEAATATGLSKKAIRNRVDRGQLRAVLRDGVRRIPHSELERAGLWPHAIEAASRQPAAKEAWAELLARLERQAAELAQLRALTREADSLRDERERLEQDFHRERAERQAAEQRLEHLAGAGLLTRRRLLRELRDRR